MKLYILDDDPNIIRILEQIITERHVGNLVGSSQDPVRGLKDVRSLEPDIILVDLLMPTMDGITFIDRVREFNEQARFIMISQVTSKEMVSKAYERGVTFYINKPINAVEVLNVLTEVVKYMEVDKRLHLIKHIIGHEEKEIQIPTSHRERMENVFKTIGILSFPATEEIIEVVEYMIRNYEGVKTQSVKEICERFNENPKTLEQKIRRTAMIGLENLAYLGLEDNLNEQFLEFSNSLYNFKEVKTEMDFIREEGTRRGKVNVRKFLDGLVYYVTKS